MEVVIYGSGDRAYTVDVTKRQIVRINGRGKPPNDDTKAAIIEAAIKQAGKQGVTVTPYVGPKFGGGAPRPMVPTPAPRTPAAPKFTGPVVNNLSDEEILANIVERMELFADMVRGASHGDFPALIVTGGPGIGKSRTTNEILAMAAAERDVKYHVQQGGRISAPMLYEDLYKYREPTNVFVLDDCEALLNDDTGMALFKAAMDSEKVRKMSWNTKGEIPVPTKYDFSGSIIMLTNQNFHAQVEKGDPTNKKIQHLGAVLSRVNCLNLMMHDPRSQWLWTNYTIRKNDILGRRGLRQNESEAVLHFMRENMDKLREVSIRAAVNMIPHVLGARRNPSQDWRRRIGFMQFKG